MLIEKTLLVISFAVVDAHHVSGKTLLVQNSSWNFDFNCPLSYCGSLNTNR